jgi:hypothetical protein
MDTLKIAPAFSAFRPSMDIKKRGGVSPASSSLQMDTAITES